MSVTATPTEIINDTRLEGEFHSAFVNQGPIGKIDGLNDEGQYDLLVSLMPIVVVDGKPVLQHEKQVFNLANSKGSLPARQVNNDDVVRVLWKFYMDNSIAGVLEKPQPKSANVQEQL